MMKSVSYGPHELAETQNPSLSIYLSCLLNPKYLKTPPNSFSLLP
ncbi:hypothetical protein BVRB_3g069550 [Beta vulgaris subsp. vulgaris]|nr:hypothetical protein BVRB_3g069550 [Beta vulgaris subsp. vulgaris]